MEVPEPIDNAIVETNKTQKKTSSPHKVPFILRLFRFIFKHISPLFPRLIGAWAYNLWFMVQPGSTPLREENWLRSATRIEAVEIESDLFETNPLPVMTYYWENAINKDAPVVMLIHGWTGRGSQMTAFAEPLVQEGFSVLSFDNHAHGKTPGKASTIFKQSEVQKKLAEKFGPLHAVVAHSFGGMITPFSLSEGMTAKKVVCISPPSRFYYLLERFSNTLHLPAKIQQYLISSFKRDYGEDLAERVSSTTTSKNLQNIPALIIHDEDDIDVPISESELLHQAWPNSIMQRTKGLGHRRILYNPQVIEDTVNFLK